jgi:hypothetical protein
MENNIKVDFNEMKYEVWNFNCCFTVHFDKFRDFLPTNALFIKT